MDAPKSEQNRCYKQSENNDQNNERLRQIYRNLPSYYLHWRPQKSPKQIRPPEIIGPTCRPRDPSPVHYNQPVSNSPPVYRRMNFNPNRQLNNIRSQETGHDIPLCINSKNNAEKKKDSKCRNNLADRINIKVGNANGCTTVNNDILMHNKSNNRQAAKERCNAKYRSKKDSVVIKESCCSVKDAHKVKMNGVCGSSTNHHQLSQLSQSAPWRKPVSIGVRQIVAAKAIPTDDIVKEKMINSEQSDCLYMLSNKSENVCNKPVMHQNAIHQRYTEQANQQHDYGREVPWRSPRLKRKQLPPQSPVINQQSALPSFTKIQTCKQVETSSSTNMTEKIEAVPSSISHTSTGKKIDSEISSYNSASESFSFAERKSEFSSQQESSFQESKSKYLSNVIPENVELNAEIKLNNLSKVNQSSNRHSIDLNKSVINTEDLTKLPYNDQSSAIINEMNTKNNIIHIDSSSDSSITHEFSSDANLYLDSTEDYGNKISAAITEESAANLSYHQIENNLIEREENNTLKELSLTDLNTSRYSNNTDFIPPTEEEFNLKTTEYRINMQNIDNEKYTKSNNNDKQISDNEKNTLTENENNITSIEGENNKEDIGNENNTQMSDVKYSEDVFKIPELIHPSSPCIPVTFPSLMSVKIQSNDEAAVTIDPAEKNVLMTSTFLTDITQCTENYKTCKEISSGEEPCTSNGATDYVQESITNRIQKFEKQASFEAEKLKEKLVPVAKPVGPWVKKTSSGLVKENGWDINYAEFENEDKCNNHSSASSISTITDGSNLKKSEQNFNLKFPNEMSSAQSSYSIPSTTTVKCSPKTNGHGLNDPTIRVVAKPNINSIKKNDDPLFDAWCDPENPRVVQFQDVSAAAFKIKSGILNTPCTRSNMSSMVGSEIFFKKEFNQHTGSFKERGARYTLLCLSEDQKRMGVIAASAGNHALALSYHGKMLSIPITVVMPLVAPIMKVQACRQNGANVIVRGCDIGECKEIALAMAREKGLLYINGYDHPHILAGQGTMGLEIVEQVRDIDAVVLPVGGGGLIAGVALAVKSLYPHIKVIGVESENCASYSAALDAGRPVTIKTDSTIADGLAVPCIGVNAFATAARLIDKIVKVKEEWIAIAILRLVEMEKAVVEGAGATGLAAMLAGELPELAGKRVVIPLCGGNIDTTVLGRCLERGLAADGRLVKFTATVSDRPGGIAELTKLMASLGVSIKDMMHERAWIKNDIFSVEVKVVCETRDYEHCQQLKRELEARYKRLRFPLPNELDRGMK